MTVSAPKPAPRRLDPFNELPYPFMALILRATWVPEALGQEGPAVPDAPALADGREKFCISGNQPGERPQSRAPNTP